ncbi:MAG: hypothetical protein GF353_24310 [Candidatus Lokiarchaeota archaeon]|nr:hypothetical protein [Candidatus Lokiarchaeota archaeon]
MMKKIQFTPTIVFTSGLILIGVGIIGIFLIFFFLILTQLYLFLIWMFPFVSIIPIGILLVLEYLNKSEITWKKVTYILLIGLAGLITSIGIEFLVKFIIEF